MLFYNRRDLWDGARLTPFRYARVSIHDMRVPYITTTQPKPWQPKVQGWGPVLQALPGFTYADNTLPDREPMDGMVKLLGQSERTPGAFQEWEPDDNWNAKALKGLAKYTDVFDQCYNRAFPSCADMSKAFDPYPGDRILLDRVRQAIAYYVGAGFKYAIARIEITPWLRFPGRPYQWGQKDVEAVGDTQIIGLSPHLSNERSSGWIHYHPTPILNA